MDGIPAVKIMLIFFCPQAVKKAAREAAAAAAVIMEVA